jgi:hypothetical protein
MRIQNIIWKTEEKGPLRSSGRSMVNTNKMDLNDWIVRLRG